MGRYTCEILLRSPDFVLTLQEHSVRVGRLAAAVVLKHHGIGANHFHGVWDVCADAMDLDPLVKPLGGYRLGAVAPHAFGRDLLNATCGARCFRGFRDRLLDHGCWPRRLNFLFHRVRQILAERVADLVEVCEGAPGLVGLKKELGGVAQTYRC